MLKNREWAEGFAWGLTAGIYGGAVLVMLLVVGLTGLRA